MRHVTHAILIATAILATNCVATASSNSIGMTVTTDRDPEDFAVPKDTKYELNGSHTFDSGIILGSSFQYTDTAFGDSASQNFEGTVGYRLPINSGFSLNGSAGIGEHWRESPSTYFPYYVLRVAADVELSQNITWNAISYRFRDGFDRDDNYDTPQLATGITYKLDGQNSISVKIMRNWKEDQPSSTGASFGFKQKF
jgi:hypothetical protein